jgi:Niemann-Pick C1 protein
MNAVSVVNLVTAIGFAVEFCIHTLLKYQNTSGSKVKRIQKALNEMGSSVFSGIFITKMLGNLYLIRSNFQGIFVLGFAPSPIFKLYYFRMYMIMILTCGFYGLCVLPGFIYIFGSDSTEEEKILENAKDEELEHINLKAKQDQNLDFEGYQDMNQEDREALKDS